MTNEAETGVRRSFGNLQPHLKHVPHMRAADERAERRGGSVSDSATLSRRSGTASDFASGSKTHMFEILGGISVAGKFGSLGGNR